LNLFENLQILKEQSAYKTPDEAWTGPGDYYVREPGTSIEWWFDAKTEEEYNEYVKTNVPDGSYLYRKTMYGKGDFNESYDDLIEMYDDTPGANEFVPSELENEEQTNSLDKPSILINLANKLTNAFAAKKYNFKYDGEDYDPFIVAFKYFPDLGQIILTTDGEVWGDNETIDMNSEGKFFVTNDIEGSTDVYDFDELLAKLKSEFEELYDEFPLEESTFPEDTDKKTFGYKGYKVAWKTDKEIWIIYRRDDTDSPWEEEWECDLKAEAKEWIDGTKGTKESLELKTEEFEIGDTVAYWDSYGDGGKATITKKRNSKTGGIYSKADKSDMFGSETRDIIEYTLEFNNGNILTLNSDAEIYPINSDEEFERLVNENTESLELKTETKVIDWIKARDKKGTLMAMRLDNGDYIDLTKPDINLPQVAELTFGQNIYLDPSLQKKLDDLANSGGDHMTAYKRGSGGY